MMICSIILSAPYYDCEEVWEINIYDDRYLSDEMCKVDLKRILGCTYYSVNDFINRIYPPVMHIVINSDYIDKFGYTNLEHEIKHIQCRCNFHD